jgi:hypothetical protein
MTVADGTGPPDGWQISAELKPKVPDPQPSALAGNAVDVTPPAWVDAAAGVRTTVKWLVAAFAAVGGVMLLSVASFDDGGVVVREDVLS